MTGTQSQTPQQSHKPRLNASFQGTSPGQRFCAPSGRGIPPDDRAIPGITSRPADWKLNPINCRPHHRKATGNRLVGFCEY
ncbi:hypothetical protein ZHAS_00021117 [Anopheles sinensis]|uniref:Uncharacterized protein n=1 Tax=Anopheles sinensis TaxID=74873 RepID=A0A084WRK2_ANOSI|nr:hypothetical protein ZHAS_00021117 [Anopheles sinensis]